jgi:acetoacetyl-CoA synthetase
MSEAADILWTPTPDERENSPLGRFAAWLGETRGLRFDDYHAIWRWSTDELEAFWGALWEYHDVGTKDADTVLVERRMPGAEWFPGAELNYAQEMLRRAPRDRPAVVFATEGAAPREIGADELEGQVGALAEALRALGVERGDRVAAFLPNVPEALVGLLATASIGAIWTSVAPEFGTQTVLERFAQVEPKVLIAADGYRFNGKHHDRRSEVAALQAELPTLEATILVPVLGDLEPPPDTLAWRSLVAEPRPPRFEQLPFDAPLWILFSSGTTGTPKGIVQGHGGIVLEHLKSVGLGSGVRPGDRVYFFCSTSWMVWNWLVGCLLGGATPVLYDGSPGHPDVLGSWRIAEATRANVFGTGAAYLTACEKAGVSPGRDLDLSALRGIISTGSPLPSSTWGWVYEHVKPDVRLDSSSGGTDVCASLISGSPWLPVYRGELSAPCLGVKAQAFDEEGRPVVGEVGELVICEPMPSMPVFFWNDPDGRRFRAAYFERFPGVWTHGDWVCFTERGSAVISGRSDATLNKAGVRMGSGDIYAIVDPLPGVADSLVVGIELPDGGYYMPLFVVLEAGADPDEVRERIRTAIRTGLSPRHLPDEIVVAPAVPRTLTGKKLEIPIKQVLQGTSRGVARGAVTQADALDWYAAFGRETVAPLLRGPDRHRTARRAAAS